MAKAGVSVKRPKASGTGPGTRTPDQEVRDRVDVTLKLIMEGTRTPEVLSHLERTYGVSTQSAYAYLRRAKAQLAEMRAEDTAANYEKAVRVREDLYRMAIETGDLANARAIAYDLGRLQGLYPQDRAALARAGLDDATKQAIKEVESPLAAVLRAAAVARGVAPPAVPQEGADGGGT